MVCYPLPFALLPFGGGSGGQRPPVGPQGRRRPSYGLKTSVDGLCGKGTVRTGQAPAFSPPAATGGNVISRIARRCRASGGPCRTAGRVRRGGSWNNQPRHCRSANRNRNDPGNRNHNNGFRVVVPLSAGVHRRYPLRRVVRPESRCSRMPGARRDASPGAAPVSPLRRGDRKLAERPAESGTPVAGERVGRPLFFDVDGGEQ